MSVQEKYEKMKAAALAFKVAEKVKDEANAARNEAQRDYDVARSNYDSAYNVLAKVEREWLEAVSQEAKSG